MQNLSLDKQLLILLNEALDKRRLLAIVFAFISIPVVLVGLQWPDSYQSSTTLIWNNANVLKPLLEGAAITNTGFEQARIANEVIYSSKNLNILIEKTGLDYSPTGKKLSSREIEELKKQLRKNILVDRKRRNNTLKIAYKNTSPELAFFVVSIISQLFIEESTTSKKSESLDAYNFIEKQLNEYQVKLTGITNKINNFKSENIEYQVDITQGANASVNSIKERLKLTAVALKEAIIRKEVLTEQLVIESTKATVNPTLTILNPVENGDIERLANLEYQLETLRLSYTDSYPEIVQIKTQIINLNLSIEANAKNQFGNTGTLNSDQGNLSSGVIVNSQLYQQLQQQLSEIEATLRTLSARKNDLEKQLSFEQDRSGEMGRVFNRLKDLTRDYNLTRALYDDLLSRRENARISLSLENEYAGSFYKIQEPPTIPLIPHGLRFLHFAIASVILGGVVPLAIFFGLLMIDPRIRHEDEIDLSDAIPVIGIIPDFRTVKDQKKQRLVTIQSVIIFSLSFVVLITLSLSRYLEVI